MSRTNSISGTRRAFCAINLQWNLAWSPVSIRPLSGLLLPHTVVTGFMPSPSLHAVSVSMMSPFAWQCVCGWGATFAFDMRAVVTLRLMPVARMPSFANGRLAESPDIRLWTTSSQGHFASARVPVTKKPDGLARQDGKRPDGLTLFPWQRGLTGTSRRTR